MILRTWNSVTFTYVEWIASIGSKKIIFTHLSSRFGHKLLPDVLEIVGERARPLQIACAGSSSRSRNLSSKVAYTKGWIEKHNAVRVKYGLPSGKKSDNRVGDLLNLAESVTSKRLGSIPPDLFTDTSQCGSREPWCIGGLRSLTTGSDFYCHAQQRALTTRDMFAVLGFEGLSDTTDLSTNQCKDLLGEAMSVQCVGVALVSLILSLPTHFKAVTEP
eukprot:6470517-Amphidinium_carterae.2